MVDPIVLEQWTCLPQLAAWMASIIAIFYRSSSIDQKTRMLAMLAMRGGFKDEHP